MMNISCPNCSKSNVSCMALKCPKCNYDIRKCYICKKLIEPNQLVTYSCHSRSQFASEYFHYNCMEPNFRFPPALKLFCENCGVDLELNSRWYSKVFSLSRSSFGLIDSSIISSSGAPYSYSCSSCRECGHPTGQLFNLDCHRCQLPIFFFQKFYSDEHIYYHQFCLPANLKKELDKKNSEENERNTKSNTKGNNGCFIATAVTGSPLSNEVFLLSRFRDEILIKNNYGKFFVNLYYSISPRLAIIIKNNNSLRWIIKYFLIIPASKIVSMLLD